MVISVEEAIEKVLGLCLRLDKLIVGSCWQEMGVAILMVQIGGDLRPAVV